MMFAKLIRGNIIPTYLGIPKKEDQTFDFGNDYTYIQCPVGAVKYLNKDKTFVLLKPEITVDPKKCRILVVPNAKLATMGQVSYQSIIEPGEGKYLGLTLKAASPPNLKSLDWLLRIYCIMN